MYVRILASTALYGELGINLWGIEGLTVLADLDFNLTTSYANYTGPLQYSNVKPKIGCDPLSVRYTTRPPNSCTVTRPSRDFPSS